MESTSTAVRDSSSTFQLCAASAPEHWDLIIVGNQVAAVEAALRAADFRGRVGLVEQRGASENPPGGSLSSYQLARSKLQGQLPAAGRWHHVPAWPFALPSAAETGSEPTVVAEPDQVRAEAQHHIRIDRLPGWAVFTGPHLLAVHGREVAFHRAILATGARFELTDVPGLAETGCITPDLIHTIREQPRQVAVLGSNACACELAQILQRLGSDVHLVSEAAVVLECEEPLARQALARALESAGVRLHLGFRAVRAEVAGRTKALVIERAGVRHKLLVEQIVIAGDRRPNLDRMGLEAAGIRLCGSDRDATLRVDARLATTNARVFAVGEVAVRQRGNEALGRMCHTVIQNAIGSARHRFDPLLVPRLTVTEPEIAQVGFTAAEARLRGMEVDSWFVRLDAIATDPQRFDPTADLLLSDGAEPARGFAIVHTLRDDTGRVAGATLVGSRAVEGIGTVALLMAQEFPLAVLSKPVSPAGTFQRALAQLGGVIDAARRSNKQRAR